MRTDGDLGAVLAAFKAVRGEQADAIWAATAASLLVMRGVPEARVAANLAPLVSGLRVAETSAEQAFGAPEDWALQVAPGASGAPPASSVSGSVGRSAFRWRPLVDWLTIMTGVAATFLAAGMMTLGGSVASETMIVAPVIIGAAAATLVVAFRVLFAARGIVAAIVISSGAGLLLSGVIAWGGSAIAVGARNVGMPALWTTLTVLIGAFAAAVSVGRWLRGHAVDAEGPSLDREWLTATEAALRARGDLTSRQVRHVMQESARFAADADSPLFEEFGPPEAFAAAVPEDAWVRQRGVFVILSALSLAAGLSLYHRLSSTGGWDAAAFALGAAVCLLVSAAVVNRWNAMAIRQRRARGRM